MFIVYFVIANDDFPEQALPLETYLNVAKKKEYGQVLVSPLLWRRVI